MLFFQLRGLADRVVEARDWAFIEKLWRDWSPGWELPAEELASVKRTLAQPGVKKAALAYYRAMFDLRSEAAKDDHAAPRKRRSACRPSRSPGRCDGCMDTRLHDLAMQPEDFPAGFAGGHGWRAPATSCIRRSPKR